MCRIPGEWRLRFLEEIPELEVVARSAALVAAGPLQLGGWLSWSMPVVRAPHLEAVDAEIG